MLKLVYHSAVFGPIDLEYDRPIIRVGSGGDNDLVLGHPSVKPNQCLLVFRNEKLLCLPPAQDLPAPGELQSLEGPELGAGDTLKIGELQFSLSHSSRTIALPETCAQPASPEPSVEEAPAASDVEARKPRYYCPHCRAVIPEAELKRVGVMGHPKRLMCPRCSYLFGTEPVSSKPAAEPRKRPWRGKSGAGRG